MVENVSLTFRNASQCQSTLNDIKANKYGAVQSVTVTDTGEILVETATHKITLKPDLTPPSTDTDYTGAQEVLGSDMDSMFQMMATLMKTLKEMRAAGRVARETEHQLQVDEMMKAAEKIREAGAKALAFAIGSFAVAAVVSAVSVGLSALSALGEIGKIKAGGKLEGAQQALAKAKLTETTGKVVETAQKGVTAATKSLKWNTLNANILSASAQASTQMIGSSSQLVGGLGQYEQARSQEQQKIHEVRGEEHQFKSQKESEQIQAMQDMIRAVLDKLKTMIELKQQAMEHASKV